MFFDPNRRLQDVGPAYQNLHNFIPQASMSDNGFDVTRLMSPQWAPFLDAMPKGRNGQTAPIRGLQNFNTSPGITRSNPRQPAGEADWFSNPLQRG